jgi:hypothetical protein
LGVLADGALNDMLEDLSYSTNPKHERMCLWLQEHYVTPFGRFHTGDGLVIRSSDDLNMIATTHYMWIKVKGRKVETDVFFVPELEPRVLEAGYQQIGMDRLPPLPRMHTHENWYAGPMQYKEGRVDLRERKGTMVEGHWTDGMGWEREIWTV